MNAVEKLEAAIEKLEAQKAESSPGAWAGWENGRGKWEGVGTEKGYDVADTFHDADARLIVTLHRTIDAQLAILREGAWQASLAFPLEPAQYKGAIALAAAILGES